MTSSNGMGIIVMKEIMKRNPRLTGVQSKKMEIWAIREIGK